MIQVFHNPFFLEDCLIGQIKDPTKCRHVADVFSNDLEAAFALTQNDDGKIWDKNEFVDPLIPQKERRSTSWGDLLIRDGIKYYIDGIGYKMVELQVN